MRDYAPIFVRRRNGALKVVHYLSVESERNLWQAWLGQELGFPSRTLPIVHENGNLIVAGSLAFATTHLLDENAVDRASEALRDAGYRPREPTEVVALLADALDLPRENVVVLPMLPGEPTGHIDMYLLALDAQTLVVPEIRLEAVDAAAADGAALAWEASVFLDERARGLRARGLAVERLPMLAPQLTGEVAAWFAPTNAVLVRVAETTPTVLSPDFPETDLAEAQAALSRVYLAEWERFFAARGWQPLAVDASRLAPLHGLLHCVTATIPE